MVKYWIISSKDQEFTKHTYPSPLICTILKVLHSAIKKLTKQISKQYGNKEIRLLQFTDNMNGYIETAKDLLKPITYNELINELIKFAVYKGDIKINYFIWKMKYKILFTIAPKP